MDTQFNPLPQYRIETFGASPSEIERMETWLNEQATNGYVVIDRVPQKAVGGRRLVNVLMHRAHETPAPPAPEGGE
ncbi:MAG: hypothetical protein K0V04_02370 [Deltaproteobacteria bacterium]|nr:hypothetical protein [Deltaproteobacteria bacterium]